MTLVMTTSPGAYGLADRSQIDCSKSCGPPPDVDAQPSIDSLQPRS